MRPVSTSCADHMGSSYARIQTWDGSKWVVGSDWFQADEAVPYGEVVRVLALVRRAGIGKMGLVTDPLERERAPE